MYLSLKLSFKVCYFCSNKQTKQTTNQTTTTKKINQKPLNSCTSATKILAAELLEISVEESKINFSLFWYT